MKFLERHHYCPECNKNISFFHLFTTKNQIRKDHYCQVCEGKVISYWWQMPNNMIISMLIALPFFLFATIFSLWRHYQGIIESVDIFIAISNIFFCGFILIYTSIVKTKPKAPEKSDNSIEKLKIFRVQILYVILFNLIGFLLAVGVNVVIWLIWTAIGG